MSPTRLGTATLSEETASLHFGLSIYRLARAVEALVRGEKAPRRTSMLQGAFAMPGADQKGESSSSSSEGGRGRRGAAASFRAGLNGMEKLDPVM